MKTRDTIRGRDYFCAIKPNSIVNCFCEAETCSVYVDFLPTCHCDDKTRKQFYSCISCLERPWAGTDRLGRDRQGRLVCVRNDTVFKATFFLIAGPMSESSV